MLAVAFDVLKLAQEAASGIGTTFLESIAAEILNLRAEMHKGFNDTLKWVLGTLLAQTALFVGLMKLHN